MKSISILVPLHIMPTEKHITTIMFENLLPELKSQFNVSIFWLVYRPEKIIDFKIPTNLGKIIDIHDFDNCVDVINEIKPDIIYENEDRGIIDLACELAAIYLKIPVIVPINNASINLTFSKKYQFSHLIKILKTFFYKQSSSNSKINNPSSVKGNCYLTKFNFLLKTMKASRVNIFKRLSFFYIIFKSMLSEKPPIFSNSTNNMYRLENENLVIPLLQKGFSKSTLYVTGNPIYDLAFKKINLFKNKNQAEKIRVLFTPLQLYENGLWSKGHQFSSIESIISSISSNSDMELITKLHPSSISLSDYKNIINKFDSQVKISQSGDILDYLSKSDVIISFPGSSTVFVYALVARKPIILCNFYNQEKHQILEKNLAIECTNINSLTKQIHSVISKEQLSTQQVDSFLQQNYFKTDGNSTKRLSDAIVDFLSRPR